MEEGSRFVGDSSIYPNWDENRNKMNMRLKKILLPIFLFATLCATNSQTSKEITFEVQGIVPTVLTLTTDLADVENLDLVNTDSTYLGKVIVYTNAKGLWTIIIKSKNAGKLLGMTAGNDDVYPYFLGFGTVDKIDLSSEFRLTYNTLVPKTIVEYPVSVSYERLEELDDPVVSDTYSDIVTIIVAVS